MDRQRGDSFVTDLENEIAATSTHWQSLHSLEESTARPLPSQSEDHKKEGKYDALESDHNRKTIPEVVDSDLSSVRSSDSKREADSSPAPPDPEVTSGSTEVAFPSTEEMLARRPEPCAALPDVFIQQRKSFRRTRREQFEKMKVARREEEPHEHHGNTAKYRSAYVAHSLQSTFHNVSLIMQGFLSGLTTAHAVFAFNFAEEELLLKGYRWMSLSVHATFYICFVLGTVSAIDRLDFRHGFRQAIQIQSGGLSVLIWMIGTLATVLTVHFDETLAPQTVAPEVELTPSLLVLWRIFSGVRALCALVAWLLLALQPNSNRLRDVLETFQLPDEQRGLEDLSLF